MSKRPPDRRVKWLNSTVLGIGIASLFSDVGHEMATTAMPALLASVGASSATLGLIEALADSLSSFAKLFSGLYSDKLRKRKPLAVAGYFVTASGMASFALATQWWHVLIGRVGGWIGRGARTLIPGVIAALLIAFLVREKYHEPQPHVSLLGGMKSLPHEFRKYLYGVGVAGAGDFSNTLLILWATQAFSARFGMAWAATIAMLFYVGYNVVYTVSCYASGLLADRFPKNRVLAIGYSIAVIPAIALMWPGASFVKFAIVFGFSGLYMGVWETLENSTAATLLPASVRGVGFGVLATVNGLGDFISSASVGFLWVISPVWAMLFVIAVSLTGAAIIAGTNPTAGEGE